VIGRDAVVVDRRDAVVVAGRDAVVVARRRHRVAVAACHARGMVPRAAAVLLLALVAGCGSAAPDELPPAAEPASSPPPAAAPAGRIVNVGFKPEGVVADPIARIFAVGVREPAELVLVDGETGDVVQRVPLPEPPRHLAFDGERVLVPAEDADQLLSVAVLDGRVASAPTGREPHDAAAASGRIFVADEFAHTLTVLENGKPQRTIDTPLQPGGVTALDRGRQVAVVSVRERVVETFDAVTGERTGRAPAGVGPTHAVSDKGDYLFVTDTTGGALLVYHLRPKLELIRRYPLPGSPYGIAIDNVRHRMYVTQTARNQLTELIVGGRPSLVARYATPQQPNTVAVDETTGRVAVTGKADGVLQLLDPGRERTR
jgi:DNA-binding beta-propeller fold protein YncE